MPVPEIVRRVLGSVTLNTQENFYLWIGGCCDLDVEGIGAVRGG